MRPVDVGFQVNVHCVSVRAVKWYTKAVLMLSSIVFCSGLLILIVLFLDGIKGVDFNPSYSLFAPITGAALGVIVGIKLIK